MLAAKDLVKGHALLGLTTNWRVKGGNLVDQLLVVRAVPWLVVLELLVQFVVLDVRQDLHTPTQKRLLVLGHLIGGQGPVRVVKIVECQCDLFQIVRGLLELLGSNGAVRFGSLVLRSGCGMGR